MHQTHDAHIHSLRSQQEYTKFAGVIGGVLAISLVLSWLRDWTLTGLMVNFMAVFFLVFAGFKLANLRMFAVTFRSYDIITKQLPQWAYAYPFVQLGLGVSYLLVGDKTWLHVVTLVISAVAGAGVLQELSKKSDIPCACLGNVIKLPLSRVSFIEDFGMLTMALFMLVF